MFTIEKLKEYGANVEEGLARCLGKEDFYFKLINMAIKDPGFEKLHNAIAAGDLDAAFDAAHALKGVTGNLSLTPLFDPIAEMTELLRARKEVDYQPYLQIISEKLNELIALAE